MSGRNDYEIRYKAIQLHQGGIGFNDVLRRVRRSCFRLTKWLQRYREHGLAGLCDQSRAPKRVHNRTSEPLVRKILALRDALAAHKGRRAAFASMGAEMIHFELQRRGSWLPGSSTIEKILARASKTKKGKSHRLAGGRLMPWSTRYENAGPKNGPGVEWVRTSDAATLSRPVPCPKTGIQLI